MPTTNWSPAVRLPFTCRSKASAGGQLEHPSEVNSSISTTFGAGPSTAVCACRATVSAMAIPAKIRLYMDPSAARKTRIPAEELHPHQWPVLTHPLRAHFPRAHLHVGMSGAHLLIKCRFRE